MDRTTLEYGHRRIALHIDTDVPQLQQEVLAACLAGCGLVSFTCATGEIITALVSPGSPVLFETHTIAETDQETDHDHFAYPGVSTFDSDWIH